MVIVLNLQPPFILVVLCFTLGSGSEVSESALSSRGNVYGAYRWISVFGISVQVGEMVKFCLIVFYAYMVSKSTSLIHFLGYLALPAFLILKQHDFAALFIICACCFGMYYLAGASWRDIGRALLVGSVALAAAVMFEPYRRERILTFLNLHEQESVADDKKWQIDNMILAIGRGGLFGQGLGQSQQKFGRVPVVNSDSIISIVAEEIGFLGVSVIFLAYMFFVYLIWRIVERAPLGKAEKLVGEGIFILFVSQIFINIAAVSGLIPLTGLTLPFMSAGGSSLVISLFLVGVIANLAGTAQPTTIRRKKYV